MDNSRIEKILTGYTIRKSMLTATENIIILYDRNMNEVKSLEYSFLGGVNEEEFLLEYISERRKEKITKLLNE